MAENLNKELASTLNITISSTKGEIYQGEAISLLAPGKEGSLRIDIGHTKVVSLLKMGDIVLTNVDEDQDDSVFSIINGILQVNRDNVEILVTQAEDTI